MRHVYIPFTFRNRCADLIAELDVIPDGFEGIFPQWDDTSLAAFACEGNGGGGIEAYITKEILSLLKRLPLGTVVENNEFHYFLERNKLMGRGLGFVDIHLLASAKLERIPLWTAVKRLKEAALNLNVSYS